MAGRKGMASCFYEIGIKSISVSSRLVQNVRNEVAFYLNDEMLA